MSSGKVLELLGVWKHYVRGSEVIHAVRGVDLTVGRSEVVALCGRSGSGKSTLLHLAAGLDVPDEGTILVGGQNLSACSRDERSILRRREIGLVFQAFHLIPTLTVRENIALPLLLDGVRRTGASVDAIAEHLGLGERLDHLPGQLSGGEMQRVAIGRALVTEPALVLADEPTGALDSETGQSVLDILLGTTRSQGRGMLLVTHDLGVAAAADRTFALGDGRLTEVAAPSVQGDRPVVAGPLGGLRRGGT